MGLKQMMETLTRKNTEVSGQGAETAGGEKAKYHRISAKEAKAVLDSGEPVILLDVREPYEYKAGHIKNAVSLPTGSLSSKAAAVLPDRNAKILVYCLSGARSSASAHALVRMGYTNVFDFGGIADWPYEVVTK
jgi:phage shock protein E